MRIIYPIDIELGKSGGIETYARNLVRCLQDIDSRNDYLLLCSVLNEEAFPVRKENFKKTVSGTSKSVEKLKRRAVVFTSKAMVAADRVAILRGLKSAAKSVLSGARGRRKTDPTAPGNDMFHFLFTTLPYWQDYSSPVILTMHDIQHEYLPEFFTAGELEIRRRCYGPSAEKADHIIAISEFTKKTIIEKYGVRKDKVSVIYLGYDRDAFKKLGSKEVSEFRKRRALPESFFLYPAATWHHKNHINLVRAYRAMKDEGVAGKLVLTGPQKENHAAVTAEIERLGLKEDILHIGYLTYGELPLLYNAASVLVFPSLFEGFGMPVAEAMASGLPVACSGSTSLPEVGGDAAVYFDPGSPEDIAEKVLKVHKDKKLREALVKKGLERAKLFTWENAARDTLKLYEKVFRERGRGKSKEESVKRAAKR